MFPIKYNGDILSHNARVGVDGGIVESLDFVNDFSEQTKRVNLPPILDVFGGAAAAYSLRRLSTAYMGNAIQVRRSSDNTTQNIGFDSNGNLNITALSSFVGTGNGTVSIWYDQSGNNRNASQTVFSNQPIIISNGNIITRQAKPAIRGIRSSGTRMSLSSQFTLTGDYAFSAIYGLNSFGRNMLFGTNGLSGYFRNQDIQNEGFSIRHNGETGETGGGNFTYIQNLNRNLHFAQRVGTTMQLAINGLNQSVTENSVQGTNFNINMLFDGYVQQYPIDADVQEIIFWNLNQSANRTAIESNINSYYQIY